MKSIFAKESTKGKDYIEGKYGVETPIQNSLLPSTECLFSIYDKVCEEYNSPFLSKNMKTAVRSVKESLRGQQTLMNMHPEDYVLVCIGEFNKLTGLVSAFDQASYYEISSMFVQKDEGVKIGEVQE